MNDLFFYGVATLYKSQLVDLKDRPDVRFI